MKWTTFKIMLFDFVNFGLPRSAKFWPRASFRTPQLFGTDQCFLYWWVQLPPLLNRVFFSCVSGFTLKFSRIALLRKRLQLDSKSDLTTNGLIVGFFRWEMASFVDFISVWTKICKNCSIVILFWRHQIFSMFSLRGILVCSLKTLVLLSHRIL